MEEKKEIPTEILVVTGLSGAGKSVALKSLEDSGFFCIDNFPIALLDNLLANFNRAYKKIGIGVDVREEIHYGNIYELISDLKKKYNLTIIFLEADEKVIIRRYKETRRPHPLIFLKGNLTLQDAIAEERKILSSIRDASDKIINTSNYSPHQLRKYIMLNYGKIESDKRLSILLISFGFKYGVPENLDLLFDVRFLPNPYFIPELKELSGKDNEVYNFIMQEPLTNKFLQLLFNLLDFLITNFISENRSYLIIGVGCTGGKHRSPVIIEEISKHLHNNFLLNSEIVHRDLTSG
ncbi:MAG: RNase adapter RapZ [Thermodesulfovibrionales bacterium]|nr:RNase adapter RapZ [Thermodesulfovibrionales bacterium]